MQNKKHIIRIVAIMALFLVGAQAVIAQETERDTIRRALLEIDPNIVKYFPRWKVCEPNLALQVYQTFLLTGRAKENLDMQNIVVTAAPKSDPEENYVLLLVECGNESYASSDVDAYMKKLAALISDPKRPYCYREVPAESPMSEKARDLITDFMLPTHVSHSISLSIFEQSLKVGNSGFWLRNAVGNDAIGYPFWTAGMSRIILQRPLYENEDAESRKPIPYLINIRLGGGYRMRTTGLERGILDFLPQRRLNGSNGMGIMSLDVNAPFHPQLGLSINYEAPLQSAPDSAFAEKNTWASWRPSSSTDVAKRQLMSAAGFDPNHVLPVLRTSGQIAVVYNWWLDPKVPENFFRFDLGVNYVEVAEWGYAYRGKAGDTNNVAVSARGNGALNTGLRTYRPTSFGEWLYARIEYRSQSTFPFGVSAQYANSNLMVRAYVPLLGEWLYLEGKYSTPLRSEADKRPWELTNFFMVSPVLRLNIR
jgi:hypothetical protein